MCSFSPLGESTPGSIYLTDGRSRMAVVRVAAHRYQALARAASAIALVEELPPHAEALHAGSRGKMRRKPTPPGVTCGRRGRPGRRASTSTRRRASRRTGFAHRCSSGSKAANCGAPRTSTPGPPGGPPHRPPALVGCTPEQAAEVAQRVDEEFENSSAETKTEPEGAFIQGWANAIGNIVLIVAAILGAVFFTILLVTGNTMAQAVRERTGELGALKAIGFSNGQIVSFVLAESCLLTVLGGTLGLGIAWLMISRGDPTHGLLPLFYFPTRDVLIGLGISVALGLVTGIFPALQAMRLRVADALRRM